MSWPGSTELTAAGRYCAFSDDGHLFADVLVIVEGGNLVSVKITHCRYFYRTISRVAGPQSGHSQERNRTVNGSCKITACHHHCDKLNAELIGRITLEASPICSAL